MANEGNLKPWKPGQSGNPKGVSSRQAQYVHDLRQAARRYGKNSVKLLGRALTAKDCPWPSKIQAASILLDRGYGKPHQTIDVNAILGSLDLSRYSAAELDALEALVSRAISPAVAGPIIEEQAQEAETEGAE